MENRNGQHSRDGLQEIKTHPDAIVRSESVCSHDKAEDSGNIDPKEGGNSKAGELAGSRSQFCAGSDLWFRRGCGISPRLFRRHTPSNVHSVTVNGCQGCVEDTAEAKSSFGLVSTPIARGCIKEYFYFMHHLPGSTNNNEDSTSSTRPGELTRVDNPPSSTAIHRLQADRFQGSSSSSSSIADIRVEEVPVTYFVLTPSKEEVAFMAVQHARGTISVMSHSLAKWLERQSCGTIEPVRCMKLISSRGDVFESAMVVRFGLHSLCFELDEPLSTDFYILGDDEIPGSDCHLSSTAVTQLDD